MFPVQESFRPLEHFQVHAYVWFSLPPDEFPVLYLTLEYQLGCYFFLTKRSLFSSSYLHAAFQYPSGFLALASGDLIGLCIGYTCSFQYVLKPIYSCDEL